MFSQTTYLWASKVYTLKYAALEVKSLDTFVIEVGRQYYSCMDVATCTIIRNYIKLYDSYKIGQIRPKIKLSKKPCYYRTRSEFTIFSLSYFN